MNTLQVKVRSSGSPKILYRTSPVTYTNWSETEPSRINYQQIFSIFILVTEFSTVKDSLHTQKTHFIQKL